MRPPRVDFTSKVLCRINDQLVAVERADLDAMLLEAEQRLTRLLAVEIHRAYGLVDADPGQLRMAIDIAEECGAMWRLARLHYELGELTHDAALSERGLNELERIGDVDQLERYLVRRRAASIA